MDVSWCCATGKELPSSHHMYNFASQSYPPQAVAYQVEGSRRPHDPRPQSGRGSILSTHTPQPATYLPVESGGQSHSSHLLPLKCEQSQQPASSAFKGQAGGRSGSAHPTPRIMGLVSLASGQSRPRRTHACPSDLTDPWIGSSGTQEELLQLPDRPSETTNCGVISRASW